MIESSFPAYSRMIRRLCVLAATLTLAACGGSSGSGTSTFSIGGMVLGLAAGESITLQNNGADSVAVSSNTTYTFATKLNDGVSYNVTATAPAGKQCTVSNGSGAVRGADVMNITIACVQPWSGTKQLGVAFSGTEGIAVTTDKTGNVYVVGLTDGGLDGNTVAGFTDMFITKYNSSGVKLYTKQLGVAGANTDGRAVVTDADDNVYVAGITSGGLDGNTLTGTEDLFVAKYDRNGVKLYTKQLGATASFTQANGIAIDASGNIYVAGTTYGGLDGNTLTGVNDMFVTKYDRNGVKLYTKQLGAALLRTRGAGVAVDAYLNVYVVGRTNGGLDGNTLAGTQDCFVTKYDSYGNKLFTRQLGVALANTACTSVATDANDNVYAAGSTGGGLDGNTLAGFRDMFVTKYDRNGSKLYTRQLGVAGASTFGQSVTVDVKGNLYVAGSTNGGLGGNTLTGIEDFFVAKYGNTGTFQYDNVGTYQYTKQLGAAGAFTNGAAVTTDFNGNVFVTGSTNGNLDGNTLTGGSDMFVTKYSPSGVKQ